MKAVQFTFSYPRYALGLALGHWFPSVLWSGASCTVMREVPEPGLLGPDWVKIKTRLGGICGTDLGNIYLKTSPYYSPFSSMPFTIGHENVGTITELGSNMKGWSIGQRVVVNPILSCVTRGVDDLCEFCARGEINLCQRFTEGKLAPSHSIGLGSRETGGSWSPSFVAHSSQLYAVPEQISDEKAMMVEPFCIGLHAVLKDFPSDAETILILGAGTVGLTTLAALRALGSKARILVSARYETQAEAARKLGANEVIRRDLYRQVAQLTGAKLLKTLIGKQVVLGGVDRVYECTGSDRSLDDANRLAHAGGKVILVGVPGIAKGIDWTAIFSQELQVIGSTEYTKAERWQGKSWHCFDLALSLMANGKADIGWMISRKYALQDYKRALSDLAQKGSQGIIKAAFEFTS